MPRTLAFLIGSLALLFAVPAAAQPIEVDESQCSFETCALTLIPAGFLRSDTDLRRNGTSLTKPVLLGIYRTSIPLRQATSSSMSARSFVLRYEELGAYVSWTGTVASLLYIAAFLPIDYGVSPEVRGYMLAGMAGVSLLSIPFYTKRRNALKDAIEAYNYDLLR